MTYYSEDPNVRTTLVKFGSIHTDMTGMSRSTRNITGLCSESPSVRLYKDGFRSTERIELLGTKIFHLSNVSNGYTI